MGLLGALLQLWSRELMIGTAAAGHCFLALTLGLTASKLLAARVSGTGLEIRRLFIVAGSLASLTLLALSAVYEAAWLLPLLLSMGLAVGALTTGIAWLLYGTLTVHRTPEILNLAGVSFGAGAVMVCVLVWAIVDVFTVQVILCLVAVIPAMLAVQAWRSPIFQHFKLPEPPAQLSWRETLNPTAALLAASLFFQAANHWTVGGWLPFYLSRKFGVPTSTSIGMLSAFWLALTWGRVLATRVSSLERHTRWLLTPTAACLLGCIFLLQTVETSGLLVGSLMLGAGIGALHPLTIGAVLNRYPYYHPGLLNGFFSLSFVGAMVVPWLVGQVAAGLGIETIIWSVLAGSLMVFLLMAVVVLETRLARKALATR